MGLSSRHWGHAGGGAVVPKHIACLVLLSYDSGKALGRQGRVKRRSSERIHEAARLQQGQCAGDRSRRLARSIDEFLDGSAPFEEVPEKLALDLREGIHGRWPRATRRADE